MRLSFGDLARVTARDLLLGDVVRICSRALAGLPCCRLYESASLQRRCGIFASRPDTGSPSAPVRNGGSRRACAPVIAVEEVASWSAELGADAPIESSSPTASCHRIRRKSGVARWIFDLGILICAGELRVQASANQITVP